MTPRERAYGGTRGTICLPVAVALALAWAACGMRTVMSVSSPDARGAGESSGGVAGTVAGQGGLATGGHTSTGSAPGVGGSTTVGHGGSGGSGSGGKGAGGSPGSGGAGSGGKGTGGSAGSGGIGSGGKGAGGSAGNGGSGSGGKGTDGSAGSGGSGSGGKGTDGSAGSGGRPGTGGTTSTVRDASADVDALVAADAIVTATPTIDPNSGYATVPAGTVILSGYVTSSAGGSGSSISLTCTENSFCASGTVGASSTYNSWANAGFNVNQAKGGASGSTNPLPLVGSTISVSYVNRAGSRLQLELWDGSDYWCCYLPPATSPTTTTIPFSSLNTKCWDNSGTAFTSGTSITALQLTVPGGATSPTPFDYCFLGLTVQ
jgi:hypothetical protein